MSFKRLALGKSGESLAEKFLKKKGYSIIHKNFRTRSGEIDLIARYQEILIFVEVKTRSGCHLGSPLDAVTARKQYQVSKVALEFLSKTNLFNSDARFDVISIVYSDKNTLNIEHIENAFDLCYGF